MHFQHNVILFLFITLSLFMLTDANLQQVFQIARHGARTPSSFEFKPDQYSEKAGELTVLGRVQNYYLGREMRKRYIEDQHLVPEKFDPSQVVVKVSGKARVVASATAFVNGLYPQENGILYENIYAANFVLEKLLPLSRRLHDLKDADLLGVHINEGWAKEVMTVIPDAGDLFFHADQGNNCPPAKERIHQIRNSQRILDLEEEYRRELYPEIVEVINSAVGHEKISVDKLNIQNAKRILDNHRCNFFHNVEHPPFSETALKELESLRYNHIYGILYKDEFVLAVSASRILEDIYRYINRLKNQKEGPKYVFYAAHDHNIEGLLAVLLDPEELVNRKYYMVEFASILSIEVYKKEGEQLCEFADGDNYYLEFLYNDEPLKLRWCEGEKCPLSKFREIVEKFVLTNLEEICKKPIQE